MEGSSLLVGVWGGSPAAKLSCLIRQPRIPLKLPTQKLVSATALYLMG